MSKLLTEKGRINHRLGSILLSMFPLGFLSGDNLEAYLTATIGTLCGIYSTVRLQVDDKRRDISPAYNSLFQNKKPLGSAELDVQALELEKELEYAINLEGKIKW